MTRFALLLLCVVIPTVAVHGQEPFGQEGAVTAIRPPYKPPSNELNNVRKDTAVSDKPGSSAPHEVETPQPEETPLEYAACRLALSLLGTVYEEIEPVTDTDNKDCGIARPIRVSAIIPGISLSGKPEMRCDTARALGLWTMNFLRPAAAALPSAPRLSMLHTGPAYSCRDRRGSDAGKSKTSEHALGNAIDIMGFEFDDGTILPVKPRKDTGDHAKAFQSSARATACLYFTTVLGPGSDAAHDDHLHLDVKSRGNGWRLCQ